MKNKQDNTGQSRHEYVESVGYETGYEKKCQHSATFGLGARAGADGTDICQRTNGRNVCGVEIVLSKSDDQTCFAHSAVSDEQQFEKKIILFRHALKCSWGKKTTHTNKARLN